MKQTKLQTLMEAAQAAPTATERLQAFLAIDGAGLPGVTGLRARQARVRARLADLRRPPAAAPPWHSREWRFPARVRDHRRAQATGDDARGLALAYSYHRHISPLFSSKRAEIVYGHAPVAVTDWDAYAKSYGRPANYTNAAYAVRYDAGRPVVDLHTVRGRTISLPLRRDAAYGHPSLLDGDLFAWEHGDGVVMRHGLKGRTGFSVRYAAISGAGEYWEHGASLAECVAEHERKLTRARAAQIAGRPARKARLIARLCGGLTCTIEDARAAGHCRAGIDAFRARYGLGESATAAELRATRSAQAALVIEQAARRAALEARA